MTLGGYLNEMALLALAAHAVTVLLARYGRPAIRHWAAASATAVVLTGPLIAISIRQRGALGPIARPGWHDLWILYHDYFGTTIPAALLLAACAVVALLPPAGWRGRRGSSAAQAGTDAGAGIAVPGRPAAGAGATAPGGPAAPGRPAKEPGPPAQASRAAGAGMATQAGLAAEADPGPHAGPEPESPWWRSGGMPLPSVALPLLLVPAALLLVESVVAPPVYVDRYVLYGEAGAALLAGAGMYRAGQWLAGAARPRALIWVPGAVVCISALLLQLGPLQRVRTPGVRLYNFGGPAFYIAAHARPGDGVLFFSSFYRKARLGYPAQFRKTSDFALATSPAVARPFRGIDKPFAAVRPLMLGHRRIWVVGLRPSASLPGPMREESMVLQRDFSRIAVQGWRGVWVTLWRRR